jgi:hypothetical protein
MRIGPFRLSFDAIQWGHFRRWKQNEPEDYQYYFQWCLSNNLWKPSEWKWGFYELFYDQPHRAFWLGLIGFNWSTQWTPWPKG